MRIIKWWSGAGMVGSDREGEVEVEDDATEKEIDAIVREEVFNHFEWGWSENEKSSR